MFCQSRLINGPLLSFAVVRRSSMLQMITQRESRMVSLNARYFSVENWPENPLLARYLIMTIVLVFFCAAITATKASILSSGRDKLRLPEPNTEDEQEATSTDTVHSPQCFHVQRLRRQQKCEFSNAQQSPLFLKNGEFLLALILISFFKLCLFVNSLLLSIQFTVIAYNPLAQPRTVQLSIPVVGSSFVVVDVIDNGIASQVSLDTHSCTAWGHSLQASDFSFLISMGSWLRSFKDHWLRDVSVCIWLLQHRIPSKVVDEDMWLDNSQLAAIFASASSSVWGDQEPTWATGQQSHLRSRVHCALASPGIQYISDLFRQWSWHV